MRLASLKSTKSSWAFVWFDFNQPVEAIKTAIHYADMSTITIKCQLDHEY